MSDFFKQFLLEDPRRLSSSDRYVALAAFGKHPGWDDHVEDLGLDTESLNIAKTVLYVNGIGGQIDSAAWDKLDPAQILPTFKHLFVWQRSGQILVGRMWSSSDGKGRKKYPMVACLHFIGVTLSWALQQALPVLGELEEGCLNTSLAEDVRELLNRKRATLREAIQSADARGEYAPVQPESLRNILRSDDAAKAEGFLRVLYQVQSQFGAFAAGKFNSHANAATVRAQQIRVPARSDTPEETILFWTRFFLTQIDNSVPLLFSLPLEGDWMDVTVGKPESHEFFCLRASPKSVPLVSEVPYRLEDSFRGKALVFLEGFQRGDTKAADFQLAAPQAPSGPGSPKKGWLKWFAVVAIIGIGVFLIIKLLPKSDQPRVADNPAGKKSEAAKPAVKGAAEAFSPSATNPAKADAVRESVRSEAENETNRLAEEKRKSEAMAETEKLKAEAAAVKEKARQEAEAAQLKEKQAKEAAIQKEKESQQRMAAEAAAKKKADDQAQATLQTAVHAATNDLKPVVTSSSTGTPGPGALTNSIGMVLVRVPSGIWVGKYEVTQAEYEKVMGNNPSKSVNERQPVEQVSWNDAVEFTRKLTELEQGKLPPGQVYSLPTDNQWKEFLGGQTLEALPSRGFSGRGHPASVGQSGPANKFGLFDLLNNVSEWCADEASEGKKVVKGGAFNSLLEEQTLLPGSKMSNCGFRCVLTTK